MPDLKSLQEQQLHCPWGDALPAPGHTLGLRPGVRWLRMALPFALDHINLWLLRDHDADGREGGAIVDGGVDKPATRAAWERVLSQGRVPQRLGADGVLRFSATASVS